MKLLTQKITPYLWFDNQAEEAVHFYLSIFENSKLHTVTRTPDGNVLTVAFQLEGQEFVALNGGPHYTFTPAISFFVNCETQEEIDEYWEKLLAGGGEEVECGWLTDKYGLSWQIVPSILGKLISDPDPVKSKHVYTAMRKMKKLEIAGLLEAYNQTD